MEEENKGKIHSFFRRCQELRVRSLEEMQSDPRISPAHPYQSLFRNPKETKPNEREAKIYKIKDYNK